MDTQYIARTRSHCERDAIGNWPSFFGPAQRIDGANYLKAQKFGALTVGRECDLAVPG